MRYPIKNHIRITDCTGRILFEGHYRSKQVDRVLDANRCPSGPCAECDDTGYIGDFEVNWIDEYREDNIYECINY